MLKKEAICHSDNFLFRADGETRTLARQCLAVHVSPQSGVRLTAGQGENPVYRITKKYVSLNR